MMVSSESHQQMISESTSSPARISFSTEFLDDANFISICPNNDNMVKTEASNKGVVTRNHHAEFEFLSGDLTDMMTADELFSEGKLLPFWQMQQIDKLNKINLKSENVKKESSIDSITDKSKKDNQIGWFLDDDPSPRPPKCTVLWKELLRLKKQRATTTLSPSLLSSSSSNRSSVAKNSSTDNKVVKRAKKELERTRSTSIRIRPMINVPICTQGKNYNTSGLPPLFSFKRSGKLET